MREDYKDTLDSYAGAVAFFVYRTETVTDDNEEPVEAVYLAGICDTRIHAEQFIEGMKLDDEKKRQAVKDKGGYFVGERLQWLETSYTIEAHRIQTMSVETSSAFTTPEHS